ncbi:hypothetical protein DY000_02061393 [Brassica cretica]|uniref:Uncharacterized protein n=1 Tax=Brassica cretica TaxID=69181 RepID=A0ABQ7ARF7_BRACR|nr:hypothetical protein DY000_02061393 [Brassica cretica]
MFAVRRDRELAALRATFLTHLAKELSLPRQEDDGSEAKKKLMEARRKMTTPTMIPPASTPEAHREEG